MGIYDRDYYQNEPRRVSLGGDRSMVINIILVNAGVFLVDFLFQGHLSQWFGLASDLPQHPWQAYQLLTYGFLHDPNNLTHILFNMLGLWFFGRDVERRYGGKEFLSLYLSLIVLSGLAWLVIHNVTAAGRPANLIGASGAITGVLLLFALNFPRRTVLIWFVLPAPAWALAILLVVYDLFGATSRGPASNVAYTCHLAGAVLALVYYRTGWSLARLLPGSLPAGGLRRRPRLHVHDPEEREEEMQQQMDEILKKIQDQGQASLTSKEKQILVEASRRYQQKRR